jgi:tellurite resistance protein
MDSKSSGAILKILNLIAMADGHLSLEEEHLLESLAKQHKLQAKMISWEDDLENPRNVTCLAQVIASEHHQVAMKTAFMVASISRGEQEDEYICEAEQELLVELAGALSLSAEAVEKANQDALHELSKQPTLWQVLYACFGSQFERPLLV